MEDLVATAEVVAGTTGEMTEAVEEVSVERNVSSATVLVISHANAPRIKIAAIVAMELVTSPEIVSRALMNHHATTATKLVIWRENALITTRHATTVASQVTSAATATVLMIVEVGVATIVRYAIVIRQMSDGHASEAVFHPPSPKLQKRLWLCTLTIFEQTRDLPMAPNRLP